MLENIIIIAVAILLLVLIVKLVRKIIIPLIIIVLLLVGGYFFYKYELRPDQFEISLNEKLLTEFCNDPSDSLYCNCVIEPFQEYINTLENGADSIQISKNYEEVELAKFLFKNRKKINDCIKKNNPDASIKDFINMFKTKSLEDPD
jgi:hypothetical protein